MKRVDTTVIKETKYIALWVLIFSVLMEAVFLILQKWNYTVLCGNLLGGGAAVLNFFLMGLSVQNALEREETDIKNAMKVSQLYRNLLLLVTAVVGVCVPLFDARTTIIALLFPRVAIALRPFVNKTND